MLLLLRLFFFFFNDTATTEIYTLSLHDALPIYSDYGTNTSETLGIPGVNLDKTITSGIVGIQINGGVLSNPIRSEEHTSELQSQSNLVCRLLLEKKKKTN